MNEYTKQEWEDYPSTLSPISSDRLNHIEDGISSNSDNCNTLNTTIEKLTKRIETLESLIWSNDSGETIINSTNGAYLKLDENNTTASLLVDDECIATESTSE